MTNFKVALDPNNPRCMVHPEQRLMRTMIFNSRDIWTCPHCNADYFDELAKRPDVIRITVGKDQR